MAGDRPRDSQRTKILLCGEEVRKMFPAETKFEFVHGGAAPTPQAWKSAQAWAQGFMNGKEFKQIRLTNSMWRPDLDPNANWDMRCYRSKLGSANVEGPIKPGTTWYCTLSPLRFTKLELLRYIAQTLIPLDAPMHGPEFCAVYLASIKVSCGDVVRRAMYEAMIRHKVKRRIVPADVRAAKAAQTEIRKIQRAGENLQSILSTLGSLAAVDTETDEE